MSARIPHLLTRLMSSAELDQLEAEMSAIAEGSPAHATWHHAIEIIRAHRDASVQRRRCQTPSARRKSLDSRISKPVA